MLNNAHTNVSHSLFYVHHLNLFIARFLFSYVGAFFPECNGVLQGALWSDPCSQHEAVYPDGVYMADEQREIAEGNCGPERDLSHHGSSGCCA